MSPLRYTSNTHNIVSSNSGKLLCFDDVYMSEEVIDISFHLSFFQAIEFFTTIFHESETNIEKWAFCMWEDDIRDLLISRIVLEEFLREDVLDVTAFWFSECMDETFWYFFVYHIKNLVFWDKRLDVWIECIDSPMKEKCFLGFEFCSPFGYRRDYRLPFIDHLNPFFLWEWSEYRKYFLLIHLGESWETYTSEDLRIMHMRKRKIETL